MDIRYWLEVMKSRLRRGPPKATLEVGRPVWPTEQAAGWIVDIYAGAGAGPDIAIGVQAKAVGQAGVDMGEDAGIGQPGPVDRKFADIGRTSGSWLRRCPTRREWIRPGKARPLGLAKSSATTVNEPSAGSKR